MSVPERLSPIAATLPPAKAMSVTLSMPCDGSTILPPFKTRSFMSALVVLHALRSTGDQCRTKFPSLAAHHPAKRTGTRQRQLLEAEPVGHEAQFLAQRTGNFVRVR